MGKMKNKFVLGIKEVIAIIFGTGAFYFLSALQIHLFNAGSVLFGSYIYMPSVMLVLLAAVFGPMVGAVAGVAGQLLACLLIFQSVQIVDIIVVFVTGFVIGIFAERFGILRGHFDPEHMIEFNALQALICIMNIVLMRPLIYLMFQHADYRDSLLSGVKVCVGTGLTVLILGTAILQGINRFCSGYCRNHKPSEWE